MALITCFGCRGAKVTETGEPCPYCNARGVLNDPGAPDRPDPVSVAGMACTSAALFVLLTDGRLVTLLSGDGRMEWLELPPFPPAAP